ncbi:unnamed protein product [Diatraea saccharalis]|uniref:Uncharacterized protein n=1 Tax=Diatraea saccharalis TaxID=40085 RepID=A0A9N9WF97_9NEOP|nr:unnamed protein product [Diatraea saccharalis]
MLYILKSLLALFIPLATSIGVDIDGIIDFGPKWNFKYNVQAEKLQHDFQMKSHNATRSNIVSVEEVAITTRANVPVTQMNENPFEKAQMFNKPHTVRDDKQINEFALHVYKQSLKVFDLIKKKVDPNVRDKVDFIARSYDEKFRNFVEDTLDQTIKTRLGTQKVVLNTIDTSNRLMRRLVNFLIGELNKEGVLRNQMNVANVLEKEVNREMALEYRHICAKFGICRTVNGFNNFMVDIFTILLKGDDKNIKQGSDAITEILKVQDFSKIMGKGTQEKFRQKIGEAEKWDTKMTRAMFMIMKNLFALKNQPLKVMMHGTEHIESTVVLLEIIDEFDKVLPPNEENLLEWNDITNSLNQWQEGKRDDVLEIIQSVIGHIKNNGIESMNEKTLENMKDKFNLLFG